MRRWLEGLLFIVLFFLLQWVCDPAHAAANNPGATHQERTDMRSLSEEQHARLLHHVRTQPADNLLAKRDYAVLRALYYSGERIQEFSLTTLGAALHALRTNYLFVPRENRKGRKRDHSIYCTQALKKALQDLITVRAELHPAPSHVDDPLILGYRGQPMTVRNFQQRVKMWGLGCGMPRGFSPHWLRHTRAMDIMRTSDSNDPRGVVKRVLGHTTLNSSGIYTEPGPTEVEQALNSVDVPRRRLTLAQQRREFERAGR